MPTTARTESEPFTTLASLRSARRKARHQIARQLDVDPRAMRLAPGCFTLEARVADRWVPVERSDFGTLEDRLRMNAHAPTPTTYRLTAAVTIATGEPPMTDDRPLTPPTPKETPHD